MAYDSDRHIRWRLVAAELADAAHVTLHVRAPAHRSSTTATARKERGEQEANHQNHSSNRNDHDDAAAFIGVIPPAAHVLRKQKNCIEDREHGPDYPGSLR